ncbi:hypothetical protein [Streptomyces melanogenes]
MVDPGRVGSRVAPTDEKDSGDAVDAPAQPDEPGNADETEA